MALAEQFTQMFRDEHRQVRDALLDMVGAFQKKDIGQVQSLLGKTAALTGPHFRYEEEALYPSLVEIFGGEYIEKLFKDHDLAIGRAKGLVELAGKASLKEEDIQKAVRYIRAILPHVSDCDGLSIMVERLADKKVQAVFDARDRALKANVNLLEWADKVRGRPAAKPD